MQPSPNEFDLFTALTSFLLAVLPSGTKVIKGQVNRVPEPHDENFVVMWELRRQRLETNVETYADVKFTAAIAGTTMTVSAVEFGAIEPGLAIFGTGIAAGTTVVAQLTGPSGGAGTYTVSPSQTLSSRILSTGSKLVMQATQFAVQMDVHGPASADNAQVISTLMRDAYAVEQFAGQPSEVVPLYADDPKQGPFVNAEQQYENRWIVEAMLQVNPVVSVPQQFADSVTVEVISVEAAYPP